MAFTFKKQALFLSQKTRLIGLLFIPVLLLSTWVTYLNDPSNIKVVLVSAILIMAGFLALAASFSWKMWIPAIIGLMLIRDFNFGTLFAGSTLKIGDLLIAYLFTLWLLIDFGKNHDSKLVKSKLDLVIVLFILFHFFSLTWSTDIEQGLLRCLKFVRNFLFYVLIRELFLRDFFNNYKRLVISYILTAIILLSVHISVILSAGGLADFATLTQKVTLSSVDLGSLRVRGTGAGFLISGSSMWFMITGAIVFGSIAITDSRFIRLLKVFFVLGIFIAAVLTLSRSTIIMLALLLMLLFFGSMYLRQKKPIFSISAILIMLIVAGLALGLGNIFQRRFNRAFEDGSWTQRLDLYRPALDAFKHSPIIGIGVGSNKSWQFAYPEIGGQQSRFVHSTYLLILSETGLLGSLLFLTMIYYWLSYLWRSLNNRNYALQGRSICMTLLAYSLAYFVYISAVGEFEDFEPWLVMAIAAATQQIKGVIGCRAYVVKKENLEAGSVP